MNSAPLGKEKKTVSTTAVGLSPTDGAQSALVSVEGAAIRYWADGSTPDASTGIAVEPGDQFALNMKLAQFLAIRRDSSDAILQVQYFDGNLDPGMLAAGTGTFTLSTSDVEIGAVELKNATDDTRAKVAATSAIAEGDNAVAVRDPVHGVTGDAAVTTNAAGSTSGKLRGLVAIFADVWDATNHWLTVRAVGGVASGAADSGNPVKIGVKYTAAGVSVADGQRVDAQGTVNGFQRVDLGTLLAGEDQANNLIRVSNVGGLMPVGTALNTYAVRITTNATTTPTAATAYVSSIVIATEAAGTTSTVKIQDKGGTPKVLVPALTTVGISTAPTTLDFQTPVLMTGGIDVITAGAAAATIDVWINYYQ